MHRSELVHTENNHLDREAARQNYFRLRDELVSLKSVSEQDQAAIAAVIHDLEDAQMAYKATHGLFGNNPIN